MHPSNRDCLLLHWVKPQGIMHRVLKIVLFALDVVGFGSFSLSSCMTFSYPRICSELFYKIKPCRKDK